MALIMNVTKEDQTFKALGNWFTIKAGKTKRFEKQFADFIAQERKEYGLVALPEEFDDMDTDYKNSEEGKAKLEALIKSGIESYLAYHRGIIYNNQVSLKMDLEKANLKVDPAVLASSGEIESMKIVAKYQKAQSDEDQKRIDEVKELMKTVGEA